MFVSLYASVETCVVSPFWLNDVMVVVVGFLFHCHWFCSQRFPKHVSKSQAPTKKDRKKKKKVREQAKASFKSSVKKGALKKATTKVDKGYGDETAATYKGYDISNLPLEAHPDLTRTNLGGHSYTLTFNQATVEVLLAKQAYYVKKINAAGTGPTGQVGWAKHGGPVDAFVVAKERSGLDRYAASASLD